MGEHEACNDSSVMSYRFLIVDCRLQIENY